MSTNATLRAAGIQLAKRVNRIEHEIREGPARAVGAAALATKTSIAGFLGGNSIVLSGVGSSGSRVGPRYDIKGTINPTALVYMTGEAHLIERDTKAHTIIGRRVGRLGKGKGSRSKEAKYAAKQDLYNALFGGGGGGPMQVGGGEWRTGPFDHPGTKGKHPFAKGVKAAIPVVEKIYERETNRGLRKAMTG